MTARILGSLLVATVGLGLQAPAYGQSLVEAARQAEDQRRANQGKTQVITTLSTRPGETPLEEPLLTKDDLLRYADARVAIAALWWEDQVLYRRMRAKAEPLPRRRDLVGVLKSESRVVGILEFHGFSPHSYVMTHMAIELARGRVERRQLHAAGTPPVADANTAFYSANRALVDATISRCAQAEASLGLPTAGYLW